MILFRKMLRDVRYNKAQFIAIFLMIFLGVFIFSGVNADWNGMQTSSQTYYEDTNLTDVIVMGDVFTTDQVQALKEQNTIDMVERRSVISVQDTSDQEKQLDLILMEGDQISKPYCMEGKPFSLDEKGIWLDQTYAQANGISLGDLMELRYETVTIKQPVVGLILHPEYVYGISGEDIMPNHKKYGFAIMSSKQLSKQVPYTQLLMKSEDPHIDRVVKETLQNTSLTIVDQEALPSYQMFHDEITQHQAFALVFPIVFLLIAVLTTLTTLTKLIFHQRLQIGVLKALGFTRARIRRHYISHVVCIAAVGAISGFIVGPLIIPPLIYNMMTSIYILPSLTPEPVFESLLLVFVSVFVCFVIAWMITHRLLKESAADALRPANIHMKIRKLRSKSNRLWNWLGFYRQWNIRDLLRNRVRSIMTVIGVAGCFGLLFCAFGLQDSLNNVITMMYHDLQTYEMRVNIDEGANIDSIKQMINGKEVLEGAIEMSYENVTKNGVLSVYEDTTYTKLMRDGDLAYVELPERGVAMSYNMANALNLTIGDEVRWHMIGDRNWMSSTVSEIIRTPASQGMTISKREYQKRYTTYQPTAIVGDTEPLDNIKGISSIQYSEDLYHSMDEMMEGMNLMIFILLLGAIVLGVVVLYNMQTLSYVEKMREMATLKVLGFRNQQVKKLLRQQNIWLSMLGVLFGIPFGFALIMTVLKTIGSSLDILIYVRWTTYVWCIVGTLLLSYFIIIWVGSRVKKIDMVQALKCDE